MLKQHGRLWPVLGINVQTILDKGVELGRPFLPVLEALNRLILELPHGYERFEVRVGHDSFRQLNGSDSQRPYIGLVGILIMLHDLGTHPIGRAHLRLVASVGVHALRRHSEIC